MGSSLVLCICKTRLRGNFVANQVLEVQGPLNRLTKYTYDPAGNVTSIVDPQGNATLLEYEPTFNHVTTITDALNHVIRLTYDSVDWSRPNRTICGAHDGCGHKNNTRRLKHKPAISKLG